MTSRRIAFGLIVWLVLQTVPLVHANQDPLPNVRELYQSADYEGALAVLDRLDRPTRDSHPELADYRVLCLLALDRRDEARLAIRAIVERDPAHRLSDVQASPRMQTAFQDLRKALLPEIVQQLYAEAKAKFEKHDPSAADTFDRLMTLLDDPDLKDAQLSDLPAVASGFRDLSRAVSAAPEPKTTTDEVRLKADTTPDPVRLKADTTNAPEPAANVAAKPTGPLTGPPDKIEGHTGRSQSRLLAKAAAATGRRDGARRVAADAAVVAARWIKTQQNYDSTLELTIDAQGNVTTVALQQPLHPMFDKALLKLRTRGNTHRHGSTAHQCRFTSSSKFTSNPISR